METPLEMPPRMHIDRGQNTLLLMPCFGSAYFSTKLVSVFPKNLLKKEPVIYGSVIFNDGQTGRPLAVMDGSKLTAMRTAAVGVLLKGLMHFIQKSRLFPVTVPKNFALPRKLLLQPPGRIIRLFLIGVTGGKGKQLLGMAAFDLYGAKLVYESLS